MRRAQIIDTLLNVLLPILLGIAIYYAADLTLINGPIRNQLPDGLWAYALVSAILIIWKREIKVFWICLIFIFFILFESLQYFEIINGTADYYDILTYFAFAIIGLIVNKYFLNHFYNLT